MNSLKKMIGVEGYQDHFRNQLFFVFALVIIYLTYFILRPLLAIGFLTLVVAMVIWPMYKRVHRFLPVSKWISSIITILLSLVLIGLPLFWMFRLIVDQLINLISSVDIVNTSNYFATLFANFNQTVVHLPLIGSYLTVDYQVLTNTLIKMVAPITNGAIGILFSGGQISVNFVINFFIFLSLLFYVLPDLDKLKSWLLKASPLSQAATNAYLRRSQVMIADVLKGSVVIAFVEAIMTSIFLIILAVPAAIIISVLVFLFALLPVLGAGVILVPLALFYLFTTQWWLGMILLLWQFLVVSNTDNILRPVLVSREAHIHPALMLVGVLGGLAATGIMGLLYGPLVMILFLTTVDIYQEEYK